MSNKKLLEKEIHKFLFSPKRHIMLTGERYYHGDHDILKRKRTVIGENGDLVEIKNLPNNKLVDNQYGRLVDQKKNYLLSKPITFNCENKRYVDELNKIFNRKFKRQLQTLGEYSLNGGISWLYTYTSDDGTIAFKIFKPSEILPFWKDEEHTELDMAIRIYTIEGYEGNIEVLITKVEIFNKNGIERYILTSNGKLIEDIEKPYDDYLVYSSNQAYKWTKIPLIAFKQNSSEIPLIKRVKALQDALNTVRSDFMNNMQEDARNTILVIKNYDGTNLAEFRKNLSEYGAVKVKSIDGADGGIDTLQVEVNSNNYVVILDMLKKSIIENARGYDARDERMSNNPNKMNIASMYSDIDLDSNGMELEFQTAFEELLYFVNAYLANTNKGSFFDEEIEVIFNRDVMINETEAITNCKNSIGVISNETIYSQHPWVTDVELEKKRIKEEQTDTAPQDLYDRMFQHGGDG